MKMKLAFASVLVLSGCGASREAMLALQDMQILENNPESTISYKSLSGWGNDLTLNDVEMRMPAPKAPPIEVVITEDDGDADAAPAVEPAPAAEPEGAKAMTIARAKSMTLKGLTLKDGKPFATDIVAKDITAVLPDGEPMTLTVKSFGFEGMNAATGSYMARGFTKDGPGELPPLEQWGFKRAGLDGLAFNTPIPQDEGDTGNVTIGLGELSVSNFANTNLGLFRLDGLKGDLNIPGELPVAGTFDFGKMDITGIRTKLFSDAFAAGMQPLLNPGEPVDYSQMYKDYTSPLESGFDNFAWTGLTSNFSGLKFDVSPMSATLKRNADGVVISSDTPRTTLKFTADASGGTLGAMGLMVLAMGGYTSDVVELYTEGHATFDPAKDLTRWEGLNLGVSDAFDVKVSGGIVGLKQALPSLMTGLMGMAETAGASLEGDEQAIDEDFEGDVPDDEDADEADEPDDHAGHADQQDHDADAGEDDHNDHQDHAPAKAPDNTKAMMSLMMGVMPLQLTDLDIEITDQKLVNLIVEPQAISSGQTVDAYRKQLVDMVTASAAFMTDAGVDEAIANELTTAVSGFLAGPGTIHITLKPKAPLGVMSAMMTPMTKENLGFSATFTAAVPPAPKVN